MIALGAFFVLHAVRAAPEPRVAPRGADGPRGTGGPLVAGVAFAIAWTPCTGPTLSAVLTAAADSDRVGTGGILLAFYSLGLAVPFLLSALAYDRVTGAFKWLRDHYLAITAVSGAVLIAMGVLLLTGELTRLNGEAQDLMNSLGLDALL